MKDDLIRKYSSGISDEFIKEYAEFSAGLNKDSAASASAPASAAPVSASHDTARRKARVSHDSKRGGAGAWKFIAAIAAVIVFVFAGLLLGRFMRRDPAEDPTEYNYPSPTPAVTDTPGPSETLSATATSVPEPTGSPSTETSIPTETLPAETAAMPEVTVTPTATAAPTGTITPAPTSSVSPTNEPAASPTAEPTASPTAELTASPTAEPTASPTAEPTASPTDQQPDEYIEAKLENIYILNYDTLMVHTETMPGDSEYIMVNYGWDSLRITGYAYSSEYQLSEVFCTLNGEPEEYKCIGKYFDRSDVAANAGYGAETASRSGFGDEAEPMQIDRISNIIEGIYRLEIFARFENGNVYKIKELVLMVVPIDNEGRYGGTFYIVDETLDMLEVNLRYCNDNFYASGESDNYAAALRNFGYGYSEYLVNFSSDQSSGYERCVSLGKIDTSLFSRCVIDYYTCSDWRAYDEGTMSEPAFFALKSEYGGCGGGANGPYKDGIVAYAVCTDPDGSSSSTPEFSTKRSVEIDLSDISGVYDLYLSHYASSDGPAYVLGIWLYR